MTEAFEDCTFGFAQNISHSNIQSSGFASGFPSKFAILGSHQLASSRVLALSPMMLKR